MRRPKLVDCHKNPVDQRIVTLDFNRPLTDAEKIALEEHIRLIFDGQIPFQSPRSPLKRHPVA